MIETTSDGHLWSRSRHVTPRVSTKMTLSLAQHSTPKGKELATCTFSRKYVDDE